MGRVSSAHARIFPAARPSYAFNPLRPAPRRVGPCCATSRRSTKERFEATLIHLVQENSSQSNTTYGLSPTLRLKKRHGLKKKKTPRERKDRRKIDNVANSSILDVVDNRREMASAPATVEPSRPSASEHFTGIVVEMERHPIQPNRDAGHAAAPGDGIQGGGSPALPLQGGPSGSSMRVPQRVPSRRRLGSGASFLLQSQGTIVPSAAGGQPAVSGHGQLAPLSAPPPPPPVSASFRAARALRQSSFVSSNPSSPKAGERKGLGAPFLVYALSEHLFLLFFLPSLL